MNNILQGWNLMRVVRLLLGVLIIIQSAYTQQWSFLVVGILFTLLPVFNIGCCAGGNCSIPDTNDSKQRKNEEINFEEIKE